MYMYICKFNESWQRRINIRKINTEWMREKVRSYYSSSKSPYLIAVAVLRPYVVWYALSSMAARVGASGIYSERQLADYREADQRGRYYIVRQRSEHLKTRYFCFIYIRRWILWYWN
jgi:hypothetical protein